MKVWLPALLFVVGVAFMVLSYFLQGHAGDDRSVVSNLVALLMLVSGLVCVLVGCVAFFLRHEEDIDMR